MEHLNNKTPFIYAHILSETQLQSRPLKETCVDHVHGFCTKGTQCAQDHGLHRVDEMPWKEGKPQVLGRNGQVNTLLRSSAVPHHQSIDLPGRYSCSGPRHNNDHENYRRINILPTVDEILSDQGPWVPQKDMTSVHHLPLGPERSLDIQFRQFRYDSTTGLICACRAVAQTLAYGHDEHYPKFNLNTNGGQQYSIFSGVRLEGLNFEEKKGISISISFSCPASWKGKSTKAIGHFQTGMLCALVGIDGDSNSLWVTFLDVQSNYTTGAMDRRYRAQGKRPEGVRAGLDLTFADPENMDDVRRMLYYHKGILQGRFLLVEFSKLLLGGFSSCLKRLQQLDSDSLAFSQQVAPKKPDDVLSNLSPPKYALEKDFKFNLKPLGCDKKMSLEEIDKMTEVLKSETTLDDGQAEALSNSLQHSFAFTQGPPGTGKSYLGVSLAQVLNASHFPNKAKPLLVVCVTNHALDDFLDSLRSAGFTKMARLGGGSKEAWTQAYSLYHISKSSGLVKTREENRACARARDNFETLFRDGYQWCEAFNEAGGGMPAWVTVQEHLREKHPHIHMQFCSTPYAGSETSSDTLKLARKSEGFIYKYWARGGDLRSINSLQSDFAKFLGTNSNSGLESEEVNTTSISDLTRQLLEDLHDKARTLSENSRENIWAFSQDERHELMAQWRFEVREEMLLDQLAEVQHRFWRARQNKFNAFNAFDSRCLAQQQVIGVTTTGCAQFWPMLRDIGFEVVICEEAGEVPESHTLCTLFPTVQHAIFIGDPKQLRPQVNDPSMSMEEAHGTLYRLDESLFERLTFPTDPSMVNFSMPMSHLTVQRRMHPVISMIPKAILYPFLKNHESTYQHPPVSGILNRMFWLDHQQPENDLDFTSPYSKSYSNSFEVEWIAEMVDYLVSSHHYSHEDIAVLTPYNGQLQALKQRLESRCKIMLSEKDRDALLDKSSLLPEELKPNGELTDVQLGSMLRLATIDNFQGEEAKVVILSLVRSNKDGKLGFVKSLNRINVACSRARNGFYIIGNSSILQRDPTWKEVIGVFKSTNRLGPTLTTCCPRHQRFKAQGVVVFVELGFLAAIYAGGLATQKLSMIHGNAKRNALKSIVADTSVITAAAILVSAIISALDRAHIAKHRCITNFARVVAGKSSCVDMFVKFLATKDNNALHVKNVIRIHVSTVNVRSFVLIEIMDQYSKFVTRKLARYYGVIMDIFRDQHLSFDPDCAQIRASPMAADANKRLISARGDKFEIIGKKIINLRDRLITPFERSLYVLVKDELRLDSRSFRVPVYGYKLRCELLFSLCRYMTHVDALNMMTHLETLEDPSFNINLLAAGIPRVIYEQIAVNFSKIEGFIQRAQKQYLPTLEVELRLLQLGLKQVADKVGRDTRVDLFDTFERIENLSSEHKVAIGSHLGTAVTFKNILWAGGRNLMTPEKLMDSFAIEMRHFEGYKLGSFDVCLRGHPMSRTAWKNCLECGSGAKRPLVKEEQNGEKHIYNDKFLEVIRSMRASHVSSQISSEE